jgi:hypothetical protein
MPIGRAITNTNSNQFRYYTIREIVNTDFNIEDYFGDLVSNRQITKMLGNGWTIDVITWILNRQKSKLITTMDCMILK